MNIRWLNPIKLNFDASNNHLIVRYKGKAARVYFDICDLKGKIIKTGQFTGAIARLDLRDLKAQQYVLLLLDGQKIRKKIFNLDQLQQ